MSIQYLETVVFPEAVKNQAFGENIRKFVKFIRSDRKSEGKMASVVTFGDVVLENLSGETVEESVVIKTRKPKEVQVSHTMFDHDAFFHNEVLFYTEVIALLKEHDTDGILPKTFPEYVFGRATNGVSPQEDIIVLKNLNSRGYQLAPDRVFLDEKHILLALEKVAKFHALSLKCMSKEPQALYKVVSKIKIYLREDLEENKVKPSDDLLAIGSARGIAALENDPVYKDRLDPLRKHCSRARYWRQKYWWTPSETLNMIIHGNFGRGNMLFKYAEDGPPIDVMFIDMATIKFGSPIVDVGPMTVLVTSPEVKKDHWDSFLRTYYGSLSSQLDGVDSENKPSFEQVDLEWRTKGVLGYYSAGFYLPLQLTKGQKDEIKTDPKNFDVDKIMKGVKTLGGDKATELICDIIKFMIDRDFVFEQ